MISRGVPSLRRVSQIEKGAGIGIKEDDEKLMSFAAEGDEASGKEGDDDKWVATHFDQGTSKWTQSRLLFECAKFRSDRIESYLVSLLSSQRPRLLLIRRLRSAIFRISSRNQVPHRIS